MPKTLTIHGLDASTAKLLMVYADKHETSLNQSVKELLSVALGVKAKSCVRRNNGLRRFRGCIKKRDADALLGFVESADFSKVEQEDM